MEFTFTYWLFMPQTWILIGLAFVLLELTDGSRIFFLPFGIAGLAVAALSALVINNILGPAFLPTKWYWMLVLWVVLAFIISALMVTAKRLRPAAPEDKGDINQY